MAEETPLEKYQRETEQEMAKLVELHNALTQEFKGRDLDDPETAVRAKNEVVSLIPDAATALHYLIAHSESDAIRKDIAKWVMDTAMKTANNDESKNALATLLDEITKEA